MRASLPSFWIKVVLIGAAVALADWLLFEVSGLGANLGLLLLSWIVALAAVNRAVLRNRAGLAAGFVAFAFALLQLERPTFVGLLIFAVAFGVAALSPRAGAGDDVWRWSQRLLAAGVLAFIGPFRDLARLRMAGRRQGPPKAAAIALAAVLPLVGGLVFVALFAAANPVIAEIFRNLSVPPFEMGRLVFWGAMALPISAALRPRGLRRTLKLPGAEGDLDLPGVTLGSIIASLVIFNLLFAVQNGLDITYLWADARLPGALTFADYAHRGAYPLIVTALLAGLFVLVFLRPGSAAAASPLVRALVVLWVAQNIFLVASAMLRTLDYIEAYSLTRMRIAALLWMVVVAAGLALILWRLMARKSGAWLINANALAAALVLAVCSVVDLGSVAANWNVRHAREVGGPGVALDLAYLQTLRGAALTPLAELQRRPLDPLFRRRVEMAYAVALGHVARGQSGWRSWRWRDARRLHHVARLPSPPLTPQPNAGT